MRTRFALILLIALAGVARAGDSPAPRPNDPDDFVRYIFDVNDSVFSEAQLLEIYSAAGYGMMGANNAVIAVSNREDIEVLTRNPFTFRYYGSDYCGF